jgi:hypothetical protein
LGNGGGFAGVKDRFTNRFGGFMMRESRLFCDGEVRVLVIVRAMPAVGLMVVAMGCMMAWVVVMVVMVAAMLGQLWALMMMMITIIIVGGYVVLFHTDRQPDRAEPVPESRRSLILTHPSPPIPSLSRYHLSLSLHSAAGGKEARELDPGLVLLPMIRGAIPLSVSQNPTQLRRGQIPLPGF